MEALRISVFSLLFLLQFSSLLLFSVAYTVPDKYFVNCGSDSGVDDNHRTFVTESSLQFSFPKETVTAKEENKSSAASPLYQTARIFHSRSTYKFRIDDQGYHLLRLHFFAFTSSNLSTARFNVSVPRFLLLDNFSAENYSNSALVKEFYLNIVNSSFQIDFRPLESSFAFVNAIELFRLPNNFTKDEAPHVSSKGSTSNYKRILSRVLHTSRRLNIGGSAIKEDNLWRKWEADQYAINGTEDNTTIALKYKGEDGKYVDPAATKFIAPDSVYLTARVMNASSRFPESEFNITWELPVKENTMYFVRAHFCDFISESAGLTIFNLYIYNNFSLPINSNDYFDGQTDVPFYFDFVVDSDDSGTMNITIGPSNDSPIKNTYLNGLEVMEIINITGPPPINYPEKNHPLPLELGLGFGALALVCISVGFVLLWKFGKPKFIATLDWSPITLPKYGVGSSHGRRASNHGSSVGSLNLGLKISFHEIQSATNNFHTKRIIGKGGFGNVYKGILKNGMSVAVKRCEPGSGQGLPEFQTEIKVLSRIRHRHLVSLIGYCDERSEMILVYEYMEKGTLRDHLYNSNLPSLSWKQRLEICIGAAGGLNYLHKGASGGIIHRDVKSTNILLDENHVAKVADFGLSRTGPLDQQPYVSTGVKGTFGYLDPEYFRSQQLTEKSDVYSFGVVLLEVLCARPALDPMLPREQVNLAEWGIFCKNKGTLEEIIDPSIKGQIDPNSLRKFSETVEKCVREDGSERPTMGDVLWDLEYSLQLQRGARARKPREDSSSGASASLQLANVRRLPSLSSMGETDECLVLKDHESDSAWVSFSSK